jgi:hypothetical protein
LVLGFLLPFIEKLALPPVLPLQDCYGIHERDSGQETWSMIGFVADYQLPCWIGSSPVESGWRRRTAVP